MPKKLRVFLDTSALLAGLNLPTGAAGAIIAAARNQAFLPVISPQIIAEAERIIPLKFPELYPAWTTFLFIPPEITPALKLQDIKKA